MDTKAEKLSIIKGTKWIKVLVGYLFTDKTPLGVKQHVFMYTNYISYTGKRRTKASQVKVKSESD